MLGITHTIPLLELCSRDMTIMKIHTQESQLKLSVTSTIFLIMQVNHHQPKRWRTLSNAAASYGGRTHTSMKGESFNGIFGQFECEYS